MPKARLFYALSALALFLVTTGLSYWAFTAVSRPRSIQKPSTVVTTPPAKKSKIDPSIPRTEVCPLNGALFTKLEKDVWDTRRPLGVMIENSPDSRPQSGLSTADVVYEAVAEGGITRFMAMFYCNAPLSGNLMIAPVRSARIYFVNLISEYDGLYNHVGGAGNCDDPNVDPRAKALCAIHTNKIKDLDQFGLDFKTCHRVTNRLDHDVAYEHTMACFLDEIYAAGAKRGWTNVDENLKAKPAWDKNFVPWKFQAEGDQAVGSPATNISYYFWGANRGVGSEFNSAFDVSWAYDSATNTYKRSNGGQPSIDLNSGEPLAFSTIIVQFVKETSTGDLEKHMLYDVIGSGKAQVFLDGVVIDATWSKVSRAARTIYKDAKGNQIQLQPGPIWISILPVSNTITYN
jgi:hypothetical protein